MKLTSSDFRSKARDALKGNWFIAVITGLVASVLGGLNGGGGGISFNFNTDDSATIEQLLNELQIPQEVLGYILAAFAALLTVSAVYSFVMFIIGSVVSIGYARFNIDLVEGQTPSISVLFSNFGRWTTAIWANLLVSIRTFLWSLLFVIPGIIAAYSYAVTTYVLADNPDMTAKEAIDESKRLMDGNRWRLFCLEISFIGWDLVSLFTLGIASLWVTPYREAARASFYQEIKSEANPYA